MARMYHITSFQKLKIKEFVDPCFMLPNTRHPEGVRDHKAKNHESEQMPSTGDILCSEAYYTCYNR
jgi:hypothetical protein